MKIFALAALLALPVLGLASQDATAGTCCGKSHHWRPSAQKYFIANPTIVYDRDSREADSRIRLKPGTWVYAKCFSYGWCKLEPRLFESAYVLRECLRTTDEDEDYDREPRRRSRYDGRDD